MILIGITGGSGTGKSTATKMLKQKISNCKIINLDEYMRRYCNEHREDIISKLDLNIGNDHWSTHLVKKYEDIKKWVSIIEKDIETCVRNIILENNNSVQTIILDWAFLSLLPIYNECDFTILVKCDLDTKLNRLTKRLEENSKLDKWNHALIERLRNTALDEFGHTATHIISNNGTLNDLENNIHNILENHKKELNNTLIFN